MRKYRYHIAAIVLLLLLVLFFRQHRSSTTLDRRETGFAIINFEDIERVVIRDGKDELTLYLEDGTWIVNSVFEAREKAVEMLLQTFGRLRAGSPVPRSMLGNVTEGLAGAAITVETTIGRRTRVYHVWSPGPGNPTYMIREGAKEPYVVEVVGFSGHVASLFVTDPGYWRPNMLFGYRPDDIAEVLVYHREDESGSFILRQPGPREYRLYSHTGEDPVDDINDSLAVRFLANFIYVPYERPARENELELSDSLTRAGYDHLVKVTCRDGSVSDLRLHRIISGYDNGNPDFDVFRLYGLVEGGSEMVIVPYHSVDLILRTSSYFKPHGR